MVIWMSFNLNYVMSWHNCCCFGPRGRQQQPVNTSKKAVALKKAVMKNAQQPTTHLILVLGIVSLQIYTICRLCYMCSAQAVLLNAYCIHSAIQQYFFLHKILNISKYVECTVHGTWSFLFSDLAAAKIHSMCTHYFIIRKLDSNTTVIVIVVGGPWIDLMQILHRHSLQQSKNEKKTNDCNSNNYFLLFDAFFVPRYVIILREKTMVKWPGGSWWKE